jgi:peptidoglycan/LPS O-acetylase OafA/YrhL
MFSLDRSKNDTSVTLDLLRAVAAQMVCVGHGFNFFLGGWPGNVPYMQNVGVLIFFLISGFLITHTLIERSKDPSYGYWQFCLERFARIYSGLLPALALVGVIDWTVVHLTGDSTISRYFTIKTLIANLFMLEAYRGVLPNSLRWSAFGSASPLWTLALEWHIYIFVGAVFFMLKKPRTTPFLIPVALFFGQTPLYFLFGAFQNDGVGHGLFALWLGGAAVYFAVRSSAVPYRIAVPLAACAGACFVLFTHSGAEYNLAAYVLLALSFFGAVAATQGSRAFVLPSVEVPIRFLADYSFSLYLVHHTIMYALWTIFPDLGLAMFATSIVVSNVAAIILAEIGEKHHRQFARILKRNFSRPSVA